MKFVIFITLNLLLSILSVSGQISGAVPVNPAESIKKYVRPEVRDSFAYNLNTLAHRLDSLRTHLYFNKKFIPQNPYLRRHQNNDDEMVFNPGPSNDRMPNAYVIIPGVEYKLKIYIPGEIFPKSYHVFP
jgi:hypothetical protein